MRNTNLPTGDRAANLAKAISCYEAALRVYTEADFPQNCREVVDNLAQARHCRDELTSEFLLTGLRCYVR